MCLLSCRNDLCAAHSCPASLVQRRDSSDLCDDRIRDGDRQGGRSLRDPHCTVEVAGGLLSGGRKGGRGARHSCVGGKRRKTQSVSGLLSICR